MNKWVGLVFLGFGALAGVEASESPEGVNQVLLRCSGLLADGVDADGDNDVDQIDLVKLEESADYQLWLYKETFDSRVKGYKLVRKKVSLKELRSRNIRISGVQGFDSNLRFGGDRGWIVDWSCGQQMPVRCETRPQHWPSFVEFGAL